MWISSLSVLQFQISRRVRRRRKNQSLKKRKQYVSGVKLTTLALAFYLPRPPHSSLTLNPTREERNPAYPTLEQSLPTSDTLSQRAWKPRTRDGAGGKKLAAFATDRNRWRRAQSVRKDARRACWGYLWQHLMLLKDCCGGCLVVWLAPTRVRTGRQMHSYVRTYIRVSLFSPWGLSVFTPWAGRLCGLEKTTAVTQGTPTSGSRRRPGLFSVFVIRERIINADLELIFQDQKAQHTLTSGSNLNCENSK